ncbi:MAG: hypothetical protein ABJB12_00860 [Pseudomonadota bacterium]
MQGPDCAANAAFGSDTESKQLKPNARILIRRPEVITVMRTYYEESPPSIPIIIYALNVA